VNQMKFTFEAGQLCSNCQHSALVAAHYNVSITSGLAKNI